MTVSETREGLLNVVSMAADHMDFLAKLLRAGRTVRVVGEKKSVATWKAAAEEAEIGAAKIREMAGLPSKAKASPSPQAPIQDQGQDRSSDRRGGA